MVKIVTIITTQEQGNRKLKDTDYRQNSHTNQDMASKYSGAVAQNFRSSYSSIHKHRRRTYQ